MIITCHHCGTVQTTLEVVINKAHPNACVHCGFHKFTITITDALAIHKMELDNRNMHMIIDGAYS